ncbi:MAG: 1-acyl-sn-glycerol-3-phosphate acyltransferase [Calditrichaeota bacterium]|nr:MAG: 1-acyl-sn-glycerol-3-phosphate acyltransferase [Calditrichota bacterium]
MSNKTRSTFIYLQAALQIIITFLLFAIFTLFVLLLTIVSFGLLKNKIIEHFGRLLGRLVLLLYRVPMQIIQTDKLSNSPAIYISNHSSTLDMFIILGLGLKNIRFVAKHELRYNPFFFLMGTATGQVFVKRNKSKETIDSMQKALNKIKQKKLSIFIAPEGTRKHSDRIGRFKKGAFHMALDLNYPIIPIFIQGAREACPNDSLVVKPGKITVYFHEPIDVRFWKTETLDQHISEVRQKYCAWDKKYS